MKVLEKILEELEERVNYRKRLVRYEKKNGTITDVVRNQGALEELVVVEKIIRSHMDDGKNTNVGSKRLIDEQPIVCTGGGWIPYTEQSKPKKDGNYLVTCDDEEYPVKRMRFKECLWYWTYGIYDGKILAWQPLPAPYKGANYNG